jgi:quaternary ammonium compound-resistance protein SugE
MAALKTRKGRKMPWILLTVAGLLEIAFALGMKWSQGFTRPMPGVLTALALRSLPVGTAYAVWTGIGAVGTAAMGALFMGDSSSPARLACMAAIVGGVAGLKLVSD